MSNKELLKQAIAEATTIRQVAIANAKEALEESLTPHLKDMLAAKLQEMEDDSVWEEKENPEDTMYEAEEEAPEEEKEEAPEEEKEEAPSEEEDEDLNIEDMTVEDLKELIHSMIAQEMGEEPGEEMSGEESGEEYADDMTGHEPEEEETIDINELLAELDAMEEDEEAPKKAPVKEDDTMKKDLEEALATVKILRSQLQEVNLLNAKLLYVNKVFKASNLTESQKVNVVAAFDRATTVREVKLVFETVSKNVASKPAPIKEHRSFASKATGVSTKEVLPQVNEQVARWQKLAGIIK